GYGNANAEFRTGTVRQIAAFHNLLAFAFNSVIIALLITVALPAIL
ncbi:MAG: hypothetical protein GX859_07685, partial [Corynebacterium humireducens]|nr:hypothetical protein [Corynebacterium humireducens]